MKGRLFAYQEIFPILTIGKEKNSAKTNSKTYIQIFAGKDFKGEVRP